MTNQVLLPPNHSVDEVRVTRPSTPDFLLTADARLALVADGRAGDTVPAPGFADDVCACCGELPL